MSPSKSHAEKLKLLVEQARKLRERSAAVQAQSRDLQKIVQEQHYEMLLLLQTFLNALPPADSKANR